MYALNVQYDTLAYYKSLSLSVYGCIIYIMCVCIYACMYVSMYVCLYMCRYVYVYNYLCMHVAVYCVNNNNYCY